MTEPAAREPVSLAVVNARVRTGVARRPWADALAVRGDRLALVGSGAEARKLGAARVIDARGNSVVAGRASADGCVDDAVLAAAAGVSDAPPCDALERGAPASFVLLDRDLTRDAGDAGAPRAARALLAVVDGRVTFERPAP